MINGAAYSSVRVRLCQWVEREEARSRRLARDGCFLRARVRERIDACAHAAVCVSDEHASFCINGCINEVEQVAVAAGATKTTRTDRAALDGIVRRRVDREP